ncbi:MAG: hypothetical protein ACLFR2_05450 [Candidatus Kapaibacterium sp.]
MLLIILISGAISYGLLWFLFYRKVKAGSHLFYLRYLLLASAVFFWAGFLWVNVPVLIEPVRNYLDPVYNTQKFEINNDLEIPAEIAAYRKLPDTTLWLPAYTIDDKLAYLKNIAAGESMQLEYKAYSGYAGAYILENVTEKELPDSLMNALFFNISPEPYVIYMSDFKGTEIKKIKPSLSGLIMTLLINIIAAAGIVMHVLKARKLAWRIAIYIFAAAAIFAAGLHIYFDSIALLYLL